MCIQGGARGLILATVRGVDTYVHRCKTHGVGEGGGGGGGRDRVVTELKSCACAHDQLVIE